MAAMTVTPFKVLDLNVDSIEEAVYKTTLLGEKLLCCSDILSRQNTHYFMQFKTVNVYFKS